MDPTGLWTDNGDGSFTAQENDTLWKLGEETGKDWHDSDYLGKPEDLQIDQIVDMGIKDSERGNAPSIGNNKEALELYKEGDGSPAWIEDHSFGLLKNSKTQKNKEVNRIRSGATPLAEGSYGVNMASNNWFFGSNSAFDDDGQFFIGDTTIDYSISSGSKTTIVDFTAFNRDGFWDVPLGKGQPDGIGTGLEWKNCTPYRFIPRSWSISFPNPENMNWMGSNE